MKFNTDAERDQVELDSKLSSLNELTHSKRHKQLINLSNQRNYKFTKDEAKQVVRLYELMLDGTKEKWTDVESYPLIKIKFDQTELD